MGLVWSGDQLSASKLVVEFRDFSSCHLLFFSFSNSLCFGIDLIPVCVGYTFFFFFFFFFFHSIILSCLLLSVFLFAPFVLAALRLQSSAVRTPTIWSALSSVIHCHRLWHICILGISCTLYNVFVESFMTQSSNCTHP